MTFRIGLFVTAALLLGAHFFRAGNLGAAAICLCSPLLFLYRRRGSLIALQVMAYCGTGVWIVTAIRLAQVRELTGRPWTAAAIILGAVALFTLLTGLLLNTRAVTERYPGRGQ